MSGIVELAVVDRLQFVSHFSAWKRGRLCTSVTRTSLQLHPPRPFSTSTKGSVVCFDIDPVHLAKTSTDEITEDHHKKFDELHSHQVVVLDWWLLSKSRWIAGGKRSRTGENCKAGAPRGGAHAMYQPGNSYYGWALALSGLAPPPRRYEGRSCNACEVRNGGVSVWDDSPPVNAR